MDYETTDVVICGGGPTGVMLSAYLGQASVKSVVLEKAPEITNDPRGISLDEDGIRLLQGLGIYDKIFTEIGRSIGRLHFVGGIHADLTAKPFMTMDCDTTEGGTGHPGVISHKQPLIEKYLRDAASRTGYAEIRPRSTMTSIDEDEDWVYVTYTDDKTGKECALRAKFMVGADGKTGFTRKKYLESKGVVLEQASQMGYEEVWVALNWKLTLPTEKSHPQFPLWKLGYTPEEVFDLFFPLDFRFLCNPKRPAVCGRFGPPSDRLWRFEFVIQKDEDGYKMAEPDHVKEVVFPYITHPGSRYGLQEDVQYPEDCIEVLRSRPFRFSARSANKWAVSRVILCGDAAHVFPPFGGQGIASGFRDASGLAWRLALACRPGYTGKYSNLLTAWYLERKQQLEESLRLTVHNGSYCTEANPIKIFIRDWWLWFLQLNPTWKRSIEQGARREGMIKYRYMDGSHMPFLPELGGGRCFPQVYCKKVIDLESFHLIDERIDFTDDVIFAPEKSGALCMEKKKGLFQIAVLLDSVKEIEEALDAMQDIGSLSHGTVLADEATFIIHDLKARFHEIPMLQRIVKIASADEFAQDSKCKNRPPPQYYDEYRIRKDMNHARFVILRPDRFVFAACRDKEELDRASRRLPEILELADVRALPSEAARL